MTPWLVVLAVEALAVVVLLALVRGVHRRGGDAVRALDDLGRELAQALLALRADTAEAQARLVELHRRSHTAGPQ
ncbi:MAG TPA: hypothetical protein VFZ83_05455 [Acidimicrobiia bacterium]|nr:hypothetical protein [Acidimicrobiia bacterium]